MENYNLHRRAQSGWHPTTYSRPVDKKPERNWAALMEAAKRKPRTDNDALEAKFGESAKGRPAGFELAREGSSPSSPAIPDGARGEDLCEPVGTMPVVGDKIRHVDLPNHNPGDVVSIGSGAALLSSGVWLPFKQLAWPRPPLAQREDDKLDPWAILKRKPTPDAPRECVSAMGLDTVAVRVDIGHGAQIDCKAARAMRGTWVRIYANGLIIPCEENDPDRIGYVR